jgi:putative NIF3 family GTP cyclohydrolase 1 type 2
MSKRDLKKYLNELTKIQLEEQLVEMYDKFKEVKVYYDFVFNPNEKNLVKDAKLKISNEYFPVRSKRPKMRRTVAQKFIKHFISLGVDSFIIADIMLYNIEIAQILSSEKPINSQGFYKSMLLSLQQAVSFMIEKGILYEFQNRVEAIRNESEKQNWINCTDFNAIIERLKY